MGNPILDKIKNKFKKTNGDLLSSYSEIEVSDSESVVINKIIGVGGYPKGRITEIFGPESSGKTTLAYHAMSAVQKTGKTAVFLDYEKTFDLNYAKTVGVVEDLLVVMTPTTLEQGHNSLKAILEDPAIGPEIGIIVIDSIAAMQPQKIVEGDAEDESMGLQARKMAKFLAWYVSVSTKLNVVSIFLNQERKNIKMSPYEGGPDTISTGGKALQFYISVRLHIKVKMTIKGKIKDPITGTIKDFPVSNIVRVACKKNKVSSPGLSADITIKYGQGIDNFDTLIEICKGNGTIQRSGPMYTYTSFLNKEEHKFKGGELLTDFFRNNPREFKALNDWFNAKVVTISAQDIVEIDYDQSSEDFGDTVSEDRDDIVIDDM